MRVITPSESFVPAIALTIIQIPSTPVRTPRITRGSQGLGPLTSTLTGSDA